MDKRRPRCDQVPLGAVLSVVKIGGCSPRWQRAIDLLEEGVVRAGRLEPTLITYNSSVSACAGSGQWQAALGILSNMEKRRMECNVITYTSVVNACILNQHGEYESQTGTTKI